MAPPDRRQLESFQQARHQLNMATSWSRSPRAHPLPRAPSACSVRKRKSPLRSTLPAYNHRWRHRNLSSFTAPLSRDGVCFAASTSVRGVTVPISASNNRVISRSPMSLCRWSRLQKASSETVAEKTIGLVALTDKRETSSTRNEACSI